MNTKHAVQLSFYEMTDIVRSCQAPYLGCTLLVTISNELNKAYNSACQKEAETSAALARSNNMNAYYEAKLIGVRADLAEMLQHHSVDTEVLAILNRIIDETKP